MQQFNEYFSLSGKAAFRLPTEPEWEYACRAGQLLPFVSGFDLDPAYAHVGQLEMTQVYIFPEDGDELAGPLRVASLRPNPWGIYDMHGNVWEWVADTYAAYPEAQSVTRCLEVVGRHRYFAVVVGMLPRCMLEARRGRIIRAMFVVLMLVFAWR